MCLGWHFPVVLLVGVKLRLGAEQLLPRSLAARLICLAGYYPEVIFEVGFAFAESRSAQHQELLDRLLIARSPLPLLLGVREVCLDGAHDLGITGGKAPAVHLAVGIAASPMLITRAAPCWIHSKVTDLCTLASGSDRNDAADSSIPCPSRR